MASSRARKSRFRRLYVVPMAVVLGAAASVAASSASAATPPGTHPIAPMPPITFPCPQGFSVRITSVRFHVYEADWKEPNGDIVTYDDGPDFVRVKDKHTGASVVENVNGPAVGIQSPGANLSLFTVGRSIVLFTPAQAASVGHPRLAGVSVVVGSTAASFTGSHLNSFKFTGHAISVCALLSAGRHPAS